MKKILFGFIALLMVNKAFSAWSIEGPTSACAGGTSNYTLKGFPDKATNINMGKITIGGGSTNGSASGASFSVTWDNFFCDENSSITIENITYLDADNEAQSYAGPVTLSNITVRRLGPISAITGNASPAICNTSSLLYSIQAVCKAQNYAWTIPSGWQVDPTTPQSGPNATTIKLIPNGSNGGVLKVTVTYVNGSCTLTGSASKTITRPVSAPVFSSPSSSYCLSNTSSVQVAVNTVAYATGYNWTYSTGWSGPGSKPSPYTNVSFNGVAQKGNVCCTATLSCGVTTPQTCLALTTYVGAPAKPSYVQYKRIGPTCYFYPYIPAVPNAIYYEWSTNGFASVDETTTDPWWYINDYFYTNTFYTISVRAVNSCGTSPTLTSRRKTPSVTNCAARINTSIDDGQKTDENIAIYPNPSSDKLTIQIDAINQDKYTITLWDVTGKEVSSFDKIIEAGTNTSEIETGKLKNGVYFLRVITQDGVEMKKEKIVVTHE